MTEDRRQKMGDRQKTAGRITYLNGPLPLDICGLHESVGPPSSLPIQFLFTYAF